MKAVYELESMIKCDVDENNYDVLFGHKTRIKNSYSVWALWREDIWGGGGQNFTLRTLYPRGRIPPVHKG
jgi:hypothetical protein